MQFKGCIIDRYIIKRVDRYLIKEGTLTYQYLRYQELTAFSLHQGNAFISTLLNDVMTDFNL